MELPAAGHLFDIALPLEVEPCSDVPNLDGCGVRMNCGELTELVPEPEECSEESKLQFFFDDSPGVNSNPFLF